MLAPAIPGDRACATAAWTSAGDLPWDANPETKSNSADERCGAIAKSRHTQRQRHKKRCVVLSFVPYTYTLRHEHDGGLLDTY